MSERKAVIKNADMSEDMQQDAVDCASQALEKYNIEKVRDNFIATNIITLVSCQIDWKVSPMHQFLTFACVCVCLCVYVCNFRVYGTCP